MTKLYVGHAPKLLGQTAEALPLAEAIARAQLESGVALLASPWAYTVARIEGRRLLVPDKETMRTEEDADLVDVFEARLFDGDVELRWLQDPASDDRLGTAVLLSEDRKQAARLGGAISTLSAHDTLRNRYVLWGSPLDAAGGAASAPSSTRWASLSKARIGVLAVPVPRSPADDAHVYLEILEYLEVVDKNHGNVAITEERLLRLSVRHPKPGGGSIETGTAATAGDPAVAKVSA